MSSGSKDKSSREITVTTSRTNKSKEAMVFNQLDKLSINS